MEDPTENKSLDSKQEAQSSYKPDTESIPVKFCKSPDKKEPFFVRQEKGDTRDKIDLFNEAIKTIAGVKDYEIAMEIITSATKTLAIQDGITDPHEAFNYILQSMHILKPQDSIEGRLAAQAAIFYKHVMMYLEKAGNVDRLDFLEKYANLGIKLLRAHNETIEIFGKYRRGGKQTIVIQQQQVNLSGQAQAIVGNFSTNDRDTTKNQGETPCS